MPERLVGLLLHGNQVKYYREANMIIKMASLAGGMKKIHISANKYVDEK